MTKKKPTEYEILVGNIGSVHQGTSREEADRIFAHYIEQSQTERGRAGGEDVTLTRNGEPFKEYSGSLSRARWAEEDAEQRRQDVEAIDAGPIDDETGQRLL